MLRPVSTVVACCLASRVWSQSAPTVEEIAPGIQVITTARANMLVRIGATTFVAGPQWPDLVRAAQALLAARRPPVRLYVLAASAPDVAVRGDGGWTRHGAITLAHEALRYRMPVTPRDTSDPTSGIQTTIGFSEVVQLSLLDDEAHVVHQHAGHSSADAVVHLEQSNVVYLGAFFTADGYPDIAVPLGGSLTGMIGAVDVFVNGFRRSTTMRYVPLRGPVGDINALRAYRDMLVTVRDRVQRQIDQGRNEAETVATKPTAEFDARWGNGPVTGDQLTALAYRSLRKH